jgi:hypothetical protein
MPPGAALAARLGPPECARAAPPRAPSSGSAPDLGPSKKCAVGSGVVLSCCALRLPVIRSSPQDGVAER